MVSFIYALRFWWNVMTRLLMRYSWLIDHHHAFTIADKLVNLLTDKHNFIPVILPPFICLFFYYTYYMHMCMERSSENKFTSCHGNFIIIAVFKLTIKFQEIIIIIIIKRKSMTKIMNNSKIKREKKSKANCL